MTLFSDPASIPFARATGAVYLTIAVAGAISIAYVPSQLVVASDPAATYANIAANKGLFHLGIAGDVVILLAEIMATAMLYTMFRPVNATLSFAAALARLSMVGVMAAMLFFHVAGLAIATGDGFAAFTPDQRFALAGVMLQVHDAGVWIWQIFFTIHLALLGWLVLASGRFPRIIGMALIVGSAGYVLDSLHAFALPEADLLGALRIGFLVIVTLAEVSFALWLTIKGQRVAVPV